MEYCSAIKKKELLPFAMVRMNLENIMLREISQSEKDKYNMTSLTCGIYRTKSTNEQNGNRLIDREQADSSGRMWQVEGLSRKIKGLMDTDNNVVIAKGRGT